MPVAGPGGRRRVMASSKPKPKKGTTPKRASTRDAEIKKGATWLRMAVDALDAGTPRDQIERALREAGATELEAWQNVNLGEKAVEIRGLFAAIDGRAEKGPSLSTSSVAAARRRGTTPVRVH
jgi:hypothetical protein